MFKQGVDSAWRVATPDSPAPTHSKRTLTTRGIECVPSWVERLGGPVWVCGEDEKIRYINPAALDLLGLDEGDCLGKPCSEAIARKGEKHEPLCSERCPFRTEFEREGRIKPVRVEIISRGGARHRVHLAVIPLRNAFSCGPALVHCGIVDDRALAIEEYLERITRRTPRCGNEQTPINNVKLTPREQEILELLAEDETLWSIANKLHVSYATVRNHVQHILAKLGVHSIIEAVAHYLVARKS